jgi:hypothetical protein
MTQDGICRRSGLAGWCVRLCVWVVFMMRVDKSNEKSFAATAKRRRGDGES